MATTTAPVRPDPVPPMAQATLTPILPDWGPLPAGLTVPVERRSPPAPLVADQPVDPGPDQSLARLARGVQDCARALASLADRLDSLERRVDEVAIAAAARSGSGEPTRPRLGTPAIEALDARVGALEGLAADRLQSVDQRLRRLETLPPAVSRLQHDAALLTNKARVGAADDLAARGGGPDLAPLYVELDAVAELVSSHHAAGTQSLERVRTLERAVLEMRRHLERTLVEHTRMAASDQAAACARIDAIEDRLTATETSGRSVGAPQVRATTLST